MQTDTNTHGVSKPQLVINKYLPELTATIVNTLTVGGHTVYVLKYPDNKEVNWREDVFKASWTEVREDGRKQSDCSENMPS